MNDAATQPIAFIGLGNPGKKYVHTRHNMGFLLIEELAHSLGWPLKEDKRFMAKVAKGRIKENDIHLLMPLTYMNESGKAVRLYLDYYKLTPSQIVVICDDTALKFGHLRLRSQGSAGGHNGLKSMIASLGTNEFARLRMGIGNKRPEQDLADYVLESFSTHEMDNLDPYLKKGVEVLKTLMEQPLENVMSQVNTKLTQT